jgi:hypothetical protein
VRDDMRYVLGACFRSAWGRLYLPVGTIFLGAEIVDRNERRLIAFNISPNRKRLEGARIARLGKDRSTHRSARSIASTEYASLP